MHEVLLSNPLPPDRLAKTAGGFQGAGYVYRTSESGLTVVEIKLDGKPSVPLSPFLYYKPTPDSVNPFNPPTEFVLDKKPRVRYFPLAKAERALRPPNHLHEESDAFFAAVNTGTDQIPVWETRYLPQSCLDPDVWNQAMHIIERGIQ